MPKPLDLHATIGFMIEARAAQRLESNSTVHTQEISAACSRTCWQEALRSLPFVPAELATGVHGDGMI